MRVARKHQKEKRHQSRSNIQLCLAESYIYFREGYDLVGLVRRATEGDTR